MAIENRKPEDRGNNIASELDLSNHVFNEKATTRVSNSCKNSPNISLASSTIAMHIDWRTEYAVGSDHLTIILSITWDLITHTTPQ